MLTIVEGDGNLLHVSVQGRLTKKDYEVFMPAVETQIETYGKLRILFDMVDFHGWTAGALWEDIKFDFEHWKDIERLAIVGGGYIGAWFSAWLYRLNEGKPVGEGERNAQIRVTRDGVEYTLLGTAHVSRASAEAVREMTTSGEFDAVAVGIGHHGPRKPLNLVILDVAATQLDHPSHGGVDVVHVRVEMKPAPTRAHESSAREGLPSPGPNAVRSLLPDRTSRPG